MKEAEDRIQANCYKWFYNTYPEYRGLLCYNLNNSDNAIQGNKNKAMGLQPGRSDMVLYIKGRAYMIEFKTPTGRQQTIQKDWMLKVMANGFEYHIVRDLEYFKQLIRSICTQ